MSQKFQWTEGAKRFTDKTVVITGGAAGMGSITSLRFAEEGADVVILDIQKEAGEETVAAIEKMGRKAWFIETDVSSDAQVTAAFDKIAADVGPYDVLFNHAGTITVKPLDESTEADYDRLMDINVKSAFLVCKRACKEMSDNGGGGNCHYRLHRLRTRLSAGSYLLHEQRRGASIVPRYRRRIPRPRHSLQCRLPRFRQNGAWPARD